MKVAQIFLTLPVGGAEDLVTSLFPEWAGRGIEQTVVCLRHPGVLGQELIERGMAFELLPCAPGKRWNLFGILRLARWLRRNRIELVHSHVYNSHQYAVPAAALARVPVLVHHHKTFNRTQRRKNWVVKQLDRWTTAHLCLAESTRTDLIANLGLPPQKVQVLPNAVDRQFTPPPCREESRRSLGFERDSRVIGNVASLSPQKNQRFLVKLMQRLRGGIPGLELVICGEGPLRVVLENQIREARLEREVHLAGNQRPIAPWLQSMELFLFPSTWEGQPLALLQAMACGVPILASRIEGNLAALGEGHPGLLALDDEEAWARAIKEILSGGDLRGRILSYQQSQQDRHGIGEYAESLQRIYERIVADRGRTERGKKFL